MGQEIALTAEDARRLTDRIKVAVEGTWQLIQEAYLSRAWSALGYSTWDEYCTREFGTARLRLPREERQEVVASLRDSGLSTRAIASATGLSQPTVRRDLGATEPNDSVDEPRSVTGINGKSYAPSRPAPPEPDPEPPSDADLLAGAEWDGSPPPEPAPPETLPTPAPAPARKPPVNITRTIGAALADIDRGRRALERLDAARIGREDDETRRMWAAGLSEHLEALTRFLSTL